MKRRNIQYLISNIFLLFISMTPVLAYYNPGSPSGFVNDFAGVIDGATKQSLEQKLVNFEKETSNEISVVTINNLGGDYIENFAAELFKEWGVGKENRDNGVLALVAVEDRKMRLEVGYGLEGALTDAQSNWIINNEMKPAFQAGKYGEGISLALESIIKATRGEYVPAEKLPQRKIANFEFIAWAAIFLLMWLAAILGRSKSWWAGGIIGGAAGVILGFIWGFVWIGAASIIGFTIFGSLFDYVVSKKYHAAKASGRHLPWWFGGGGFGGGMSGSGGFGGFGGGMSGGGGSSGSW
ncbi:methanol dehydrogenase [Candidatus Falkowbacteria bacterium CG10_big_fil_rev_8_21_14_0_10_44_15]|uniref:Methanol dehydrogenase n=1 Tax=Candidatus Falkowbacteria bacterium CG10_big_fil_rev_8_21_14_0_10_44_15 TaxID=1974569 RepID=A0A2H0V125_9BACT|nr:MAG: methanol dehydrogenase [Candidatus Falkowbacteria bacterium CG10_big_fil_rev_8_21_14_0_10_44_15]